MRSAEPMPGNPWPHDMVISIEDSPYALLELLWIREAWALEPAGADLPPLLVDAPVAVDAAPSERAGEWRAAWEELWAASVAHAGVPRDPSIFERLAASANGSAQRAELLRQLHGPSWRDRFGDEGLTGEFQVWNERQSSRLGRPPVAYDQTPEWMALDALVPAWRAGLTTLIVIPCRGTHTRRVGSSALLLTAETRSDPGRYADALRSAF